MRGYPGTFRCGSGRSYISGYHHVDRQKFGVEHALSMFATRYVFMPGFGIYQEEVVTRPGPNLATCHIY